MPCAPAGTSRRRTSGEMLSTLPATTMKKIGYGTPFSAGTSIGQLAAGLTCLPQGSHVRSDMDLFCIHAAWPWIGMALPQMLGSRVMIKDLLLGSQQSSTETVSAWEQQQFLDVHQNQDRDIPGSSPSLLDLEHFHWSSSLVFSQECLHPPYFVAILTHCVSRV